jgi:hypothetical protein
MHFLRFRKSNGFLILASLANVTKTYARRVIHRSKAAVLPRIPKKEYSGVVVNDG